jgi:serine/threonine protein kinase/predicted ATPase
MIFGKYQLLDLLGRGGMAEVYKAKSYGVEGFEKLLVIKRILPALTDNERFVDMFINEAKIAVSLNHANIVQVFDLGKVVDSYYIAMEYVHGMDLASVIRASKRTGKRIPVELAAFIGSEVAKGLDYAHRRRDQNLEPLNIIHRDISPHNILISYEGEVKITDFGIAKAKDLIAGDEKGTVKGKYAYMAPEQARGKEHDRRVDIFSLGVVIYESIAGVNPLKGGKSAEILRRIQNKSYAPLGDSIEDEGLEEIVGVVSRAMEPYPDKRYIDASEFYEALIAFLYNARMRVGAHSLATFLGSLREADGAEGEGGRLADEFGSGSGSISVGTGVSAVEDQSDVTPVQVPGGTQAEETPSGTGTGTASLSAELREVTVLAMEFVGPPASGEALKRFKGIVSGNGGAVVDERSDLLIGIFGLDIADGLDTQDAIEAGMKLQRSAVMDESTLALQIGIGICPAKIVLTASGVPREDDAYFNAVSDARSLAKRGIGWVITSEAGRQLSRDSFRFEDVMITTVNGAEQSVCKVVGRRPASESYGRLFGRRDELRAIGEVLAMVSRGSGRVLNLIGEAGTGKTRIVHEVKRRLVSGGHDVGWYEAICVPWRSGVPLAAVGSMFRSILGISEIETEHEVRARVERLRELGLIPEEVDSVAVLLGLMREREVGPEERGRQLRSALVRAASSLCSDKLTVFFWDNLSYVDKESFEILKYLGTSVSHMPLLLVFASRPGSLTDTFTDGPAHHRIGLNPLSERDSKNLALSRMQARRAPEDLLIDIALKSGGNPLYIEEYIKALMANKIVKVRKGEARYKPDAGLVDFPKTLRGLVGARIKRLPVEQRGLLQRAAVIGQRFNLELFSAVTGVETEDLRPILSGLKDVGLLTRMSSSEYAFASDLVRDVVYDGIILSDRREIHGAIARAIEDIYAERLDEFVERLAIHYREGGERSKAVNYLIRAGEKVALDYSHQAALDYYMKALELLQNVPRPDSSRILSVYLPIGELAIKTNDYRLGIKKMQLAEELAEEVGDRRSLIQIMRITAEMLARSEKNVEAQQYFQRAIELADELDDIDLRCEVRATAGQVYLWIGDMKKAAPYYREVIELYSGLGKPDLLLSSYAGLARSEAMSDEPEQALKTVEKAEKLVNEKTSPNIRCHLENAHSEAYYIMRDMEKSLYYLMRGLEISREYNIKEWIARNAHNIGDAYLWLGDYRKAFTYFRLSQDIAEETRHDMLVRLNSIFLSYIDALKFGSEKGLTEMENALMIANECNSVWEQIQVHYFLGSIYFERKKLDKAETHIEQSLRIGRAADNKVYETPAMDLLEQIREQKKEKVD